MRIELSPITKSIVILRQLLQWVVETFRFLVISFDEIHFKLFAFISVCSWRIMKKFYMVEWIVTITCLSQLALCLLSCNDKWFQLKSIFRIFRRAMPGEISILISLKLHITHALSFLMAQKAWKCKSAWRAREKDNEMQQQKFIRAEDYVKSQYGWWKICLHTSEVLVIMRQEFDMQNEAARDTTRARRSDFKV